MDSGNQGVLGFNNASGGTGVEGDGSGNNSVGVKGNNTSGNGYGVWGVTTTGFGVYGQATGNGSAGEFNAEGTGYGVYAKANNGSGTAGYFYGSVTVNGVLTVNSCTGCSDARLKKNVKPLGDSAIDQLLKLKGVTFEWVDPKGNYHERETGTVLGFIAQDVEKLYPEWVDERGYTGKDGTTYRTLDMRQIEALEVESIRTLKDRADKADARADKAEKRVSDLADHLDRLEHGGNPNRAGFTFGNGGYGVAGIFFGLFIADKLRKKKDEKQA